MAEQYQEQYQEQLTPEVLLDLGIGRYEEGSYFPAISYINVAIAIGLTDYYLVEAHYYKGLANFKLMNFGEAAIDLTAAITSGISGTSGLLINEEIAKATFYRGISYFKLEKYLEAVHDLSSLSLEHISKQDSIIALFFRGVSQYYRRNNLQAKDDLDQVIDSKDLCDLMNQEAYFYRALVLKKQGKKIEALNDLNLVIDSKILSESMMMEAYYTRGLISFDDRNYSNAEGDFNQVINCTETLPDFLPYAFLYRGIAKMKQEKLAEVQADLDKALTFETLPEKQKQEALDCLKQLYDPRTSSVLSAGSRLLLLSAAHGSFGSLLSAGQTPYSLGSQLIHGRSAFKRVGQ